MKRLLKWTGYGLAGLFGLLLVTLSAVYGVSEYRLRRTYQVEPSAVSLLADPATLERGKHIATVRGCVDCHSPNLAGKQFIDEPIVGRLFASNLTSGRGGVGATYTDADWLRAIRHGVAPTGRPLLFMPSQEFNVLNDQDAGALVAYLKSLPPVDNEPVPNSVGPVGRALYLKGDLPLVPAELIDHTAPRPQPVAEGATAEYGAYLSSGCIGCHGPSLSGGPIPGAPPGFPAAANLTPDPETGLGRWTEADFFTAIRTGKRPDGTEIRPEMPWKALATMSDTELRAIWLHLEAQPGRRYAE